MARRAWFGGFGVGVLVGAVGAMALVGGHDGPRALAQAQAPNETNQPPNTGIMGRYRLSAWAHPGTSNDRGSVSAPSFGAYVLDSAGGQLWLSRDGGALQRVARAR